LSHVVIIGHESAGFTAASTARATDKQAKITVIERRPYPLYHPCGIPFAISGEIPDIRVLIEDTRPLNVDMRLETEAKSIDPVKKTVEIVDLKSGKISNLAYDSLIIATGGYAIRPSIDGMNLNGVHTLRTVEDGEAIIKTAKGARRAVVVGAGAIGVETSAALRRRGLDVLLVELMPHLLPTMLDQDMAEIVTQRLQKEGILVRCGQQLKEIKGDKKVGSVIIGEEEHPADLVVVAVGVKPETSLAREAGIKLGPTGGIKVDNHLRTSAPQVFAAGDCAETRNLIIGEPTLSQVATTAIKMGKVAGRNAVGGKATFNGTLNTVVTSAFDLIIASTGLTASAARKAGLDIISARIKTLNRPHYYPGARPIYVKLVVETKEKRVVGGQVIGIEGVAERVDMLALAIQKGMRVDELADIEHCYMPSVGEAIEPLSAAAEVILRKL
jgi:NADH oxidase (H2O2-forming)